MCIVNTKQKLSSAFDASVICAVEKFSQFNPCCLHICVCAYLYFGIFMHIWMDLCMYELLSYEFSSAITVAQNVHKYFNNVYK